jgi:ssDNA-binding replication factor A large subunit
VNDRIRIVNGWVNEWRGNLQVSAGRYGKIELLGSGLLTMTDSPD